MKRLLDYDPLTGIRSEFESTPEGFQVHYSQDAEPIIEANKAKAKEGVNRKSEFRHVADVPLMVQMKWLTEFGVDVWNKDHWPAVKRLLNDPEWRYLKTAEVII